MKDNKKSLVTVLTCTFILAAFLIADSAIAEEMAVLTSAQSKAITERNQTLPLRWGWDCLLLTKLITAK